MAEKRGRPFKQVVANFPFHNFNEIAKFVGIYERTVELGEDEKFEANIFIDVQSGEAVHITNSYSIDKAIKLAKEEYPQEMDAGQMVFDIEFLGKTEIKGKPFNQFNIGYCTLQQYEDFFKPEKKPAKA